MDCTIWSNKRPGTRGTKHEDACALAIFYSDLGYAPIDRYSFAGTGAPGPPRSRNSSSPPSAAAKPAGRVLSVAALTGAQLNRPGISDQLHHHRGHDLLCSFCSPERGVD